MRNWLRGTDKPAMTAVEKFTLEDDWLLHRERAVAWLRVGFAVVGVIVIQLNPERVARLMLYGTFARGARPTLAVMSWALSDFDPLARHARRAVLHELFPGSRFALL